VTALAADDAGNAERVVLDSTYSWLRLAASVLISTIGGVGLWSVVVVLPTVQADFGVDRAEASIPYTLVTLGFAFGGVMMGRLADRFGIMIPIAVGGVSLGLGYIASAFATNIWQFALAHVLLIGFLGSSASFAPLMADVSHWFARRRGIAVAICASGNYLAGGIWSPIVQHFVSTIGWRHTHIAIGVICAATMLPLALLTMRRRAPTHLAEESDAHAGEKAASLGLSPSAVQMMLAFAGFACCVAMAMPQVHIVAYCSDLGYGVARGAEMLSLMLLLGIISRVGSGFIADRLGGVPTLLIGSGMQAVALLLYLAFNGLTSLYVVSALFGLFQGGIVPMYAIIVREYFSPREAGARVGIVIMASLFGMAFGGWMSGKIFDYTGSYQVAFANGFLFNLLNIAIALWLLWRPRRRVTLATA
jgi:MFS family permease